MDKGKQSNAQAASDILESNAGRLLHKKAPYADPKIMKEAATAQGGSSRKKRREMLESSRNRESNMRSRDASNEAAGTYSKSQGDSTIEHKYGPGSGESKKGKSYTVNIKR